MLAVLLLAAFAMPSGTDASASVAVPQPAQAFAGQGPFMPGYRSACIHSLREFAYALSNAVESGDVNRLAALYRWQGLSTRAGYDTMARLQEIVARPLLQVSPVYPQRREQPLTSTAPDAAATGATPPSPAEPKVFPPLTGPPMFEVPLPPDTPAAMDPALADAAAAADPAGSGLPRSPPVGLRLDQTLANGVTPAATTLRLQRELGCWWVSL
ncbi:MAG: hypothetical protein ACTHOC_06200 [Luteimonas sp.]